MRGFNLFAPLVALICLVRSAMASLSDLATSRDIVFDGLSWLDRLGVDAMTGMEWLRLMELKENLKDEDPEEAMNVLVDFLRSLVIVIPPTTTKTAGITITISGVCTDFTFLGVNTSRTGSSRVQMTAWGLEIVCDIKVKALPGQPIKVDAYIGQEKGGQMRYSSLGGGMEFLPDGRMPKLPGGIAPECEGHIYLNRELYFHGSVSGTLLNILRPAIKSFITSSMGGIICNKIVPIVEGDVSDMMYNVSTKLHQLLETESRTPHQSPTLTKEEARHFARLDENPGVKLISRIFDDVLDNPASAHSINAMMTRLAGEEGYLSLRPNKVISLNLGIGIINVTLAALDIGKLNSFRELSLDTRGSRAVRFNLGMDTIDVKIGLGISILPGAGSMIPRALQEDFSLQLMVDDLGLASTTFVGLNETHWRDLGFNQVVQIPCVAPNNVHKIQCNNADISLPSLHFHMYPRPDTPKTLEHDISVLFNTIVDTFLEEYANGINQVVNHAVTVNVRDAFNEAMDNIVPQKPCGPKVRSWDNKVIALGGWWIGLFMLVLGSFVICVIAPHDLMTILGRRERRQTRRIKDEARRMTRLSGQGAMMESGVSMDTLIAVEPAAPEAAAPAAEAPMVRSDTCARAPAAAAPAAEGQATHDGTISAFIRGAEGEGEASEAMRRVDTCARARPAAVSFAVPDGADSASSCGSSDFEDTIEADLDQDGRLPEPRAPPSRNPDQEASWDGLINQEEIPLGLRIGMPLLLLAAIFMYLSAESYKGCIALLDMRTNDEQVMAMPVVVELSIFSLLDGFSSSGTFVGALIVVFLGFFSGFWPYMKLLTLLFTFIAPTHFLSKHRRQMILDGMDAFGKWSMVDFYMMIFPMLIAPFRFYISDFAAELFEEVDADMTFNLWIDVTPAYQEFFLATFLSLVCGLTISAANRKVEKIGEYAKERKHTVVEGGLESAFGRRRLCNILRPPNVVAGKLYAHSTTFFIIFAMALIFIGLFLPMVTYELIGLAANLGDSVVNTWSLAGMTGAIAAASSEGPTLAVRWIQVVFCFFTICAVMIYLPLVLFLWLMPMTVQEQRKTLVACQILNAIQSFDVFIATGIFVKITLREVANYFAQDFCDHLSLSLSGIMPGLECRDIFECTATLHLGAILLVIAALTSTITGQITLSRSVVALMAPSSDSPERKRAHSGGMFLRWMTKPRMSSSA